MGDKNKQWHGGKGSQRRNSDEKAYGDNYDNISWEGSEFWKGRDKIESNISYDIPVQPDDNPSDIEKDYDEPVANTYTRPQNTYPEPTTGG
jgi:hypothetical protein